MKATEQCQFVLFVRLYLVVRNVSKFELAFHFKKWELTIVFTRDKILTSGPFRYWIYWTILLCGTVSYQCYKLKVFLTTRRKIYFMSIHIVKYSEALRKKYKFDKICLYLIIPEKNTKTLITDVSPKTLRRMIGHLDIQCELLLL